MPTISMGDGKQQTINKFLNSAGSKLLCDLDAPSSEVASDLNNFKITSRKDAVFYMIQEMEGWFLSQPLILDEFYNIKISEKLTVKHGNLFEHPDKELQRLTKGCKKGTYHKVQHGVELLKLLDSKKLAMDFSDFKRLIESLAPKV